MIKLGLNNIKDIKIGNRNVLSVYVGENKVYPDQEPKQEGIIRFKTRSSYSSTSTTTLFSYYVGTKQNKITPTMCKYIDGQNWEYNVIENGFGRGVPHFYYSSSNATYMLEIDLSDFNYFPLELWTNNKSSNTWGMFRGQSYLTTITPFDIGDYCYNFSNMFNGCSRLTDISFVKNWNVGNSTSFNQMFYQCSGLTSVGDISNWNVENSNNFGLMFSGCSKLTSVGDISNWNVENATTFSSMFYVCSSLTSLDLSNWNVGKSTSFKTMFDGCNVLTSVGDLSNWNVEKSTTFESMFDGCNVLTSVGDLSNWNVEKSTTFYRMFYGCIKLTSVDCFKIPSILQNVDIMFLNCSNLTNFTIPVGNMRGLNFVSCDKLTRDSVYSILYNCANTQLNIPQLMNFSSTIKTMIDNDDELTTLKNRAIENNWLFESVDFVVTGTISSTSYTPKVYVNSTNIDENSTPVGGTWISSTKDGNNWSVDLTNYETLSSFAFMFFKESNTSNVNRYVDTINLPQNISMFKPYSMFRMFCASNISYQSLTTINGLEYIDTSECVSFRSLFDNCGNLTSVDGIQNWDTSKVENMRSCFANTGLTNLDVVQNWNVSNVKDMQYLFYNTQLQQIPDISNWDTSKVSDMSSMFSSGSNLTTIKGLPQIGTPTTDVNTTFLFGAGNLSQNPTNLTTIEKSGKIYVGFDISYSPLDSSSAKVILESLQVPSTKATTTAKKTIKFNTTTIGYINNDKQLNDLAKDAISKGWTITGFSPMMGAGNNGGLDWN